MRNITQQIYHRMSTIFRDNFMRFIMSNMIINHRRNRSYICILFNVHIHGISQSQTKVFKYMNIKRMNNKTFE